ncbi:DUF2637 domain-containing protein [Nocardiopsis gilva YIM 90087]|uniref:DUF2637 domain-containing protein n=1 Tax=Nocardiopsis gilva YIM 90087 TaxID=1235441 RepID=A0A223S660_9ACTN|nr:DUF2637 domain-containing protein [Nocardiopsis gilva]ASU83606.1 DUF2637 domain-containing protein [Nocardiopsis gilva YIM 90087]
MNTTDLRGLAAPAVEWITGPLVRVALVLALCLVLIAVAQWMLRRMLRHWQDRDHPAGGLERGDRVAIAVIISLAFVFVSVAFAMSAAALHDSATWLEDTAIPINGGDLRILFPLVLDGLIVLFLALDLWTEWRKMRHPYYRWVAYGLSVLTLYLNVSHGEDGSLFGHAAPPLGVIVISEGLAIWIRSMAKLIDTGKTTDRVPMGHWIARPASAFRVSRLMLGWNITSYEAAVEMERRRSMAKAMLRQQYGDAWRRATPEHVRWMLNNGHDLDVAYDLTRALTRQRVAMTPEEVAAVASLPDATPQIHVADTRRDSNGQATGARDTRSLMSRLLVRSGHDRLDTGRDTPALSEGDTPPALEATGDTAQVTADVAPVSQGTRLLEEGDTTPRQPGAGPSRPVASLTDMADRDKQVVAWLVGSPDMSGAEIGRRVGATAKTGQRLRKRLLPVAEAQRDTGTDTTPPGEESGQTTRDSDTAGVLPKGVRVKHWKRSS